MNPRRLIRITAEQTLLLDANKYETFVIWFASDVKNLRIKNVVPGRLYVFLLKQDEAGEHDIYWGNIVGNAARIDPAGGSVTVQCFVGLDGGVMKAIAPGTWI